MRRAEEILAEAYEADGWKAKANDVRNGNHYPEEDRAIRAIEQAQREAIEDAVRVLAGSATPFKRTLEKQLRALLPHREGQ